MEKQIWDGMLSGKDFRAAAFNLVDVWINQCTDFEPWRWQDCSQSAFAAPDSARGYLVLEDVPIHHVWLPEVEEGRSTVQENEDLNLDPTTQALSAGSEYCFYTYHVLYNESYRVPRLYFQGRFPDGRVLSWEEIQQDLQTDFREVNEHRRWTFVTQEEHPYLWRPWFSLHPCGTSSLMSMIYAQRCCQTSSVDSAFCGDLRTTLEGLSTISISDSKVTRIDEMCSTSSPAEDIHPLPNDIMQYYMFTWLSFASQAVGLRLPASFNGIFSNFHVYDAGHAQ